MQNQDQYSQSLVIDQPGQSASEIQPGALGSAGRRRTQEQGQGDLDDDRQDAIPAAAPEEAATRGHGVNDISRGGDAADCLLLPEMPYRREREQGIQIDGTVAI